MKTFNLENGNENENGNLTRKEGLRNNFLKKTHDEILSKIWIKLIWGNACYLAFLLNLRIQPSIIELASPLQEAISPYHSQPSFNISIQYLRRPLSIFIIWGGKNVSQRPRKAKSSSRMFEDVP